MEWLNQNKDAISALATLGGAIGFLFAIARYYQAENWKRTEFLANLYKSLADDPACQRAMWMLDWSRRDIDFGLSKPISYSYDLLVSALRIHKENDKFNVEEMLIRDTFDKFFWYIEQFERAIRNKVVKIKHVQPYCAYWVDLLKGRRHMPDKARTTVNEYIDCYGFSDVRRFLDRWK